MKVKKVKNLGESSDKALDLRKASSKVHPPPPEKSYEEDPISTSEEEDVSEEDQLAGLSHSQILEMQWKKRNQRLKKTQLQFKNKKEFD
jgi:hypothetical protein